MPFLPLLALLLFFVNQTSSRTSLNFDDLQSLIDNQLTESEIIWGQITGRFGSGAWINETDGDLPREGRQLGPSKGSRLWPNGRVPYEFADTIDFAEWQIMQLVFSNISSVTNIEFVPRTARDSDYLLITEDIDKFGCGCCSIGLGYLQGSGPHVLVLAPVAKGGCGVNHIGGTHELLHILGLAHVQNRADRCNYIDVNIDTIKNWGEWRVSQLTDIADWFKLRVPYDCSSTVHYYQLQGAFWKDDIEKKVDKYMKKQGCENSDRGKYINACLVKGGHTDGNRIVKEGYDLCLDNWASKHKQCVDNVIKRFPTFNPIDPNGRCKANGINKTKRKSYELSQWDIWAINAAYGGPLPPCQKPKRVGDGKCDTGNNNIGCNYDGGDCCLPEADARDCIDPCGVRLKFYGGSNRPCGKAPEIEGYCADHYWYGPNKCSDQYCRVTDEKYLQWQCKKTCNLCNTDPSRKEMDKICDAFIGPSVKAKYSKNYKPPKTKPKPPQKFFNSNIVTAKPLPFIEPSKKTKQTVRKETPNNRPKSSKKGKSDVEKLSLDVEKLFESVGKVIDKNKIKVVSIKVIDSIQNEINSKPLKKKGKRPNETPRSSSFSKSSNQRPKSSRSKSSRTSKKGGFVVVSDPERRRKLRSYWMRAG